MATAWQEHRARKPPISEDEQIERAVLRWIVSTLNAIGDMVHESKEREIHIMADLTALSAALDELGADIGTLVPDVQALVDAVNALVAGNIPQATIDDLVAKATAVDVALDAVDASVKAAIPPTA